MFSRTFVLYSRGFFGTDKIFIVIYYIHNMKHIRRKMTSIQRSLGILGEFLGFLWERKMYWMIPMFLTLILIGGAVLS